MNIFKLCTSLQLTRDSSIYSLYVLLLLLIAYLLNQLDRYTLAVVTKPLAQEIHYGDKGCLQNETSSSSLTNVECLNVTLEEKCVDFADVNGTFGCKWDYTGQGFDYQILAGPIFIMIYTFAGIPVGLAADTFNRKVLLGISVAFWSICTLLTGFVHSYWELVLLRFGLGLGQAGCSPFSTSLIADYFPEHLRGAAMGVYNWGIYTGYSLSFALGNFITEANINGEGWRWAFIIAGLPGIFLGILIILTVREPTRLSKAKAGKDESGDEIPAHENSICGKFRGIYTSFFRPSVLLLCLAGSIRNAAGYVWAYNSQVYFDEIGQTRKQIGWYMFIIPLIFGSIGVVLGGYISDRFVKNSGPHGRIWVLIASQMIAAPFAACVLLLPPPWGYFALIPTYLVGEMWVGVTLAVLVELVPADIKTTCIAAYFFIITNIGGYMPLLVPILKPLFENGLGVHRTEALKYTLLCLYPGEYVLGSLLFMVTLFVLKRDITYIKSKGCSPGSRMNITGNMEKAESTNSISLASPAVKS